MPIICLPGLNALPAAAVSLWWRAGTVPPLYTQQKPSPPPVHRLLRWLLSPVRHRRTPPHPRHRRLSRVDGQALHLIDTMQQELRLFLCSPDTTNYTAPTTHKRHAQPHDAPYTTRCDCEEEGGGRAAATRAPLLLLPLLIPAPAYCWYAAAAAAVVIAAAACGEK